MSLSFAHRLGRLATRRLRPDSRGQAMVEFAIILPLLLTVIFALVQFGILFANEIEITNAARDAARKAAVSRSSTTGVADAKAAAKASTWLAKLQDSNITVTPLQPWTAGQDVTVTVTYPYSVNILGVVVKSGTLSSRKVARVE
jgi:Flp pilus assembly protein TadG